MKYGRWEIASPETSEIEALRAAGYSPLTAYVLSARGYDTPEAANALLRADAPLIDPFQMKEMERAAALVRRALEEKQKIAVFGDYDVDGITATCLLVEHLRSLGGTCVTHIPERIEEGYGLNAAAIRRLYDEGVRTMITVDCGITAIAEAELCRELGLTLVITDHHECKENLPRADAVVDPHRPDRTYPHTDLSGVGVAFKLAAALSGDQEALAERYCDLFCLGTIADIMPLRGENRRMVVMGLRALQNPKRVGIRALMEACDCRKQEVTASTVGFVLAPRINAAGRMESAELAVRLFLTEDAAEAAELAETLCRLNRERQETELEIYREATERLRKRKLSEEAIVLAGENWHQGVVGIVASRLSEEFCRPTFLICMNGENGKASSRSYGGFNLFASLRELSELLEGYGGHELAAGFTIRRDRIEEFRRRVCEQVGAFSAGGGARTSLKIDCEVPSGLLTEQNVSGLSELEPCGTACPKPVFCISEASIERLCAVGGGKHLRLQLRTREGASLQAIYFSGGAQMKALRIGMCVDVAFHAQINEYRGVRTVQLSVLDLRAVQPEELYDRFQAGQPLSRTERRALSPERADVTAVWQYLCAAAPAGRTLRSELAAFCSAVAASSGERHSVRRTVACLAILQELGFLDYRREESEVLIRILPNFAPNPLENSRLYHALRGD